MGSDNLDDPGVTELVRNLMIMSIVALFIVIICVVAVHFFPKRRRQAPEDTDNDCEQQGLDDSVLKTIQVVQFDPERFKEGLECAICLSEVKEGEKTRVLPACDHGFHMECIDMWFHSHSTCPVCRKLIVDRSETSKIPSTITHSHINAPAYVYNPLYTSNSSIMNPKSKTKALIFLAMLLIALVSSPNGVQGRLMSKTADLASSTSQTLKNLQAGANGTFKKVETSFRHIPPSRSNPIQNK
ncbi:hypothetical protein L1987_31448 [Smallanthus sonchifolius]|uniref:Uncharacterized protein n=1 Tax=Smallanthus sonchifolius TaxID=185202 RepID=A0ACB9I6U1_9ASTR|nr:hypothetical protein L1987_31448 [Smallanthus sonchifolius]